jgi:hypothetical protein
MSPLILEFHESQPEVLVLFCMVQSPSCDYCQTTPLRTWLYNSLLIQVICRKTLNLANWENMESGFSKKISTRIAENQACYWSSCGALFACLFHFKSCRIARPWYLFFKWLVKMTLEGCLKFDRFLFPVTRWNLFLKRRHLNISPSLECVCTVCDLCKKDIIDQLEMIHHRSLLLVSNRRENMS